MATLFPAIFLGLSLAVSLATASDGALMALRAAAALPPAEAMRTPAPNLLERLGFQHWLSPAARIAIRPLA